MHIPEYMPKDKLEDKSRKITQILIGNIVKQIDVMQGNEVFAKSFDQTIQKNSVNTITP